MAPSTINNKITFILAIIVLLIFMPLFVFNAFFVAGIADYLGKKCCLRYPQYFQCSERTTWLSELLWLLPTVIYYFLILFISLAVGIVSGYIMLVIMLFPAYFYNIRAFFES